MLSYCIIVLVTIWIAVCIFRGRRRTRFYKAGGQVVFQDVYAGSRPLPTYEFCWSYGYPSFTVRFRTAKDKAAAEAEGRNARFSTAIAQLCDASGSRKHPFDVAKGVCFISKEELDDFVERTRRAIQQSKESRQQRPAPLSRARSGTRRERADVGIEETD